MRIISKGNQTVTAVCGLQKNTEGRIMRPSVCMIKSEIEDGTLLYNSLTGELLLLENGESTEDEAIKAELIKKWFYVPENFDECKYSEQIRTIAEMLAPRSDALTAFTVFTTTDCNARCFYCYEKGSRKIPMSETTAQAAAEFMIRSCKGKKVSLHWFGGEPLCNTRAIDIITQALLRAEVEYTSQMISNAYLFDEETVKKAKELWRLKEVQITLDGTENTYNRVKAFIYENSSAYQTVLENIDRLLGADISVNIRLNLNRANSDDLMQLADELKARFGEQNRLYVYAALLYDYIGSGNGFPNAAAARAKQKQLQEKLCALGLSKPKCLKEEYRITQCMAANDNGVTILPDGHLGKCEHFPDDGFIGSIYDGITDKALVKAWKERKQPTEQCKSCAAFPLCSVGLKNCPSNREECTKEYRDGFLEMLREQMSNTYRRYAKQTKTE